MPGCGLMSKKNCSNGATRCGGGGGGCKIRREGIYVSIAQSIIL